MFDLNINHYNKLEIEELFGLKSNNYNFDQVEKRLLKLKDRVNKNKSINESVKQQTLGFLFTARDTLIKFIEGESIDNIYQNNELIENGNHFIINRKPEEPGEFNYNNSINPIKKRVSSKIINIDTRFRENYKNDPPTNFQVNLSSKINNVITLDLHVMEPPATYYTISEKLHNNYFHISIDNAEFQKITIPDGNYKNTGSSVISSINEQISDCSFNFINGNNINVEKIIVTSTNNKNIKLDFTKKPDGLKCETEPKLELKLGWILGFKEKTYEQDGTITSDAIPDFGGPKYCFLIVDDFQKNVNESIISTSNSFINGNNILARVSFHDLDDITQSISSPLREYFGPVDIQKLKIQLLDEYGRIIDTNGNDFSFCLRLKTAYDM